MNEVRTVYRLPQAPRYAFLKTTVGAVLLILITATAGATGAPPRNALNVCPLGVAFGIFSVNYQRQVGDHHGLVIRGDYEAIPEFCRKRHVRGSGIQLRAA